jgi:glycosyltransferase involved in cell wall biosynthesis
MTRRPPEHVSVVVPVHRNAATLRELHRRLDEVLGHRLRELVLVDDACPEGSSTVIRDLSASDPRVRPVALRRNVGQHAAVLAGLRTASGDSVAVLDADLQDPPESLPALLDRFAAGDVHAVFGGRRGRYQSTVRILTSRAFKRLQHALVGVPIDAGLFVVMSRELVRQLVAMGGPSPSLVVMIGCTGRPTTSVPVARTPRQEGRSAYSHVMRLLSAWRAVRWAMWWKLRGAST